MVAGVGASSAAVMTGVSTAGLSTMSVGLAGSVPFILCSAIDLEAEHRIHFWANAG